MPGDFSGAREPREMPLSNIYKSVFKVELKEVPERDVTWAPLPDALRPKISSEGTTSRRLPLLSLLVRDDCPSSPHQYHSKNKKAEKKVLRRLVI